MVPHGRGRSTRVAGLTFWSQATVIIEDMAHASRFRWPEVMVYDYLLLQRTGGTAGGAHVVSTV
ncbi:MAG: hypothetical protein ACRERE_33945 [Candidatus Entotheonellia bacterium]|jgi:hypothetical protein